MLINALLASDQSKNKNCPEFIKKQVANTDSFYLSRSGRTAIDNQATQDWSPDSDSKLNDAKN